MASKKRQRRGLVAGDKNRKKKPKPEKPAPAEPALPAEAVEALALARASLRDTNHGYSDRELCEPVRATVARITALLKDGYDFDSGKTADERGRKPGGNADE